MRAALALLLALGATNAFAQQFCGSRQSVLDMLKQSYHEKPFSMGLSKSQKVTVITKSNDGTWAEVVVNPDGTACVIDMGDGWETIDVQDDQL